MRTRRCAAQVREGARGTCGVRRAHGPGARKSSGGWAGPVARARVRGVPEMPQGTCGEGACHVQLPEGLPPLPLRSALRLCEASQWCLVFCFALHSGGDADADAVCSVSPSSEAAVEFADLLASVRCASLACGLMSAACMCGRAPLGAALGGPCQGTPLRYAHHFMCKLLLAPTCSWSQTGFGTSSSNVSPT